MSSHDENALDAQDVADILQVSRNTVYNLVKAGELSSYMVGRKMRFTLRDVDAYIDHARTGKTGPARTWPREGENAQDASPFRLAGCDVLADLVSNALGSKQSAIERTYVNGYVGLEGMYTGGVDAALVHLYDRKTGRFNVPYVQRMVPGTPLVVFHVAKRTAGFLVRRGNPKRIRTWRDLLRADVVVANRERGAGSRIMLDEYLVSLAASADAFDTAVECASAQAAASFVAQGHADCAIGGLDALSRAEGLHFVPQLEEDFALVVLKSPATEETLRTLRRLLPSRAFRDAAARATGYDTDRAGDILYEV